MNGLNGLRVEGLTRRKGRAGGFPIMPIWQPAFPRGVPDRCSTTQPSRQAQCGLQCKEQSCTRRGPANPCLLSSFCFQPANASVDDHHGHHIIIIIIVIIILIFIFILVFILIIKERLQPKGNHFGLFPLTGLGVCAVSDDESAALHRDIVKLTWTTATLAAGTGVLACASSAWQAGLGWGLHLQESSIGQHLRLKTSRDSQRTPPSGSHCGNIQSLRCSAQLHCIRVR